MTAGPAVGAMDTSVSFVISDPGQQLTLTVGAPTSLAYCTAPST